MRIKLVTLLWAAVCVLTLSFAAPAMAGTATNISNSWKNSTTVVENFNFGNPATTSTTALPAQVQGSITLGTLETYLMAAILFGP